MWNDEDYKSMEKLTGFSEEDVQKENKKALQILLYSLAFIFILGILSKIDNFNLYQLIIYCPLNNRGI